MSADVDRPMPEREGPDRPAQTQALENGSASHESTRYRGVGIEIATGTIRGACVAGDRALEILAAAELPFALHDVDSVVLERLVHLRAELGDPADPVRIAWFPPGSTLQRIDVTGRSGPELNEHRRRLELDHDITSTLLADEGPRRWLYTIRWDGPDARRLEDLAERAGFVDVAVEPAPISLARVLPAEATFARRLAAQEDAFEVALAGGTAIAAASADVRGRIAPALDVADRPVPPERFDGLLDDVVLSTEIAGLDAGSRAEGAAGDLVVVGRHHPRYPDSDLRAPARIAVALGAAVAASGAVGVQRPVDMMVHAPSAGTLRPWAIERVSDLPEASGDDSGGLRRLSARFVGRRRRNR
jgi:hypothetical protein